MFCKSALQCDLVVDLLALLDDDAIGQLLCREADGGSGDLLAINEDASLGDQTAGLAVGGGQTGLDHHGQDANGAVRQVCLGQLGGGHVLGIGCTAEQGAGGVLGFVGLFLAVDHAGQLVGQDLLCLVQALILPGGHLVDLLQRQEGQHPDALHDIGVADVAPVLVELEGAGLVGVEPDGVAGGLAHLLALGVGQQGDGHGVGVLAQLAADELSAAQHVAPLVVAAELHVAAVVLEHVVEVVALHDHVVKFEEGQALLHPLLVALGAQHVVDREAGTHVTQQLDVVQVQQPVGVVQHQGLALGEVDELFHLLLEAGGIVGDVLFGQHLAHVGAAGGIADHGGASADQSDGLVASHLQALHQGQRHKMACGQAVGSAVEADVKGCLAVVDEVDDLLVGDLRHQAAGFEFFVQSHEFFPPVLWAEG